MLYGTECKAVKNQYEHKLSIDEMRMLRWICGKTRQDRVRYDNIRERIRGSTYSRKDSRN